MEYYRTGKQDGRGNGSWGALCSASGISDQFSTLNSRQASTSDSQSVAVQSPRHWSAQRREKCLFRNQIVENRPEPLDDLTPRVLEPRSSSNFPLSRNFDPSPFVNPSSSPSSLDSSYSIYIYIYDHPTNQRREEDDALYRHRRSNFLSAELNRHESVSSQGKLRAKHRKFRDLFPPPKLLVYLSRERLRGRECDEIGLWTFAIVSRINKIRRYARVFVDPMNF